MSDELHGAVLNVRRKIKQHRDRKERISEEATKLSLIVPLLRGLGWDTTDLDEVFPEWGPEPKDNKVDFALLLQRTPRLFVEAKALDTNLDDRKWKGQIIGYAGVAGVEWCVLTDGDRYSIYNAHAPVDVDQKHFRTVWLSDDSQDEHTLATLRLLSRDELSDTLDEHWSHHFIDRRVHATLEAVFEEKDSRLINLIRHRTPDLKPSAIKASLQRANIIVDFPALPATELVSAPVTIETEPAPPKRKPAGRRVTISDLLSGGLAKPGERWRAKTKGREAFAEVTPEGDLQVADEKFSSPSAAASKVTGYPVDGWHFWSAEASDGTWRKVNELRQQMAGVKPDRAPSVTPRTRVAKSRFTPEDHLAGKPETQALFAELLQQTEGAVGECSVHANSKHIVFSGRRAFMVINAQKRGLRLGLRLVPGEVGRCARLQAQPKGIFEGWDGLHVSTSVPRDGDIDDELIGLIRQAFDAAR